jgi:hypothetical protein
LAQYDVVITGSPPNFTVSVPPGPYTNPSVNFAYNSANLSDQCKVWYKPVNISAVSTQVLDSGSNFTVNSGVSFNVTAVNVIQQPQLSHVIHQGNI